MRRPPEVKRQFFCRIIDKFSLSTAIYLSGLRATKCYRSCSDGAVRWFFLIFYNGMYKIITDALKVNYAIACRVSIGSDLRVPPGNRLEKLKGDLANRWSIRVNDQFRIVFRFDNDAEEVEIMDYH